MSETATGSATGSPDDPVPGEGDPAAVGTKGGGEWPSKASPPTGAAPGSDPERAAQLREQRKEHTTAGDGTAAGELHPETRLASPYEQRPDQAGVGSTPVDGDRAEGNEAVGSAGEADEEPGPDDRGEPYRGPRPVGAPTTELA